MNGETYVALNVAIHFQTQATHSGFKLILDNRDNGLPDSNIKFK